MKTIENYSPSIRILSLILSFLVIFYLIPTSVFADAPDSESSNDESTLFDENDPIIESIRNLLREDDKYICNDGLEGYFPTVTHSSGAGGAGSINLSTGRLTLTIPTLTTTDALFAFTPTLVYNSSLAGEAVTSDNTYNVFASSYMPNGFKLNIQETIVQKSYSNEEVVDYVYYVLNDSDGTSHCFFEDENGKYYDDDGLRLELTVSEGSIQIKDTSEIAKNYSQLNDFSWHLTSITDKYGNQLSFYFNESNQPTKVIVTPNGLSNIEMLQFFYENGKLCKVYNSSSKDSVILICDENNNLTSVEYRYGDEGSGGTVYETASYTYDANGYITKIEDSQAGKSLEYEITDGKVTKISEKAGTTLGQQISYTYGEGYTDIRPTGNDEILHTSDDIITRYVFDNYGRAVSVYSMSSDGTEIYGATAGSYETQENVKNNLKSQVILGGSSVNYVLNGGFEKNTTHWSVSETQIHLYEHLYEGEGNKSLEFIPNVSTPAYAKQRISLRGGSYTLSMLVSAKYCSNYSGLVEIIEVSDSTVIHSEEIPLNTISNLGETTYFSTTFELGESSDYTTIDLIIKFTTTAVDSNAEIQIDRVMLDNHIGSADYSLVEYGSFDSINTENDLTNYEISSSWVGNYEIVTEDNPFNNSMKISSSDSQLCVVSQRVFTAPQSDLSSFDSSYNNEIGNNHGHEYIVSAFAKSETAQQSSLASFRIVVEVAYYQGSGKSDVIKTYDYDFVPDCNGWQFVCGHVPTKIDEKSSAKYNCIKYINVKCEYSDQNQGYALFDNISLIYATGDNLAKNFYDINGNLNRILSGGYEENYVYNDNNDITMMFNNQNEIVEYIYESDRPNVLSTVNKYQYTHELSDSIIKASTVYTYDSYGLCTSTKIMQYDVDGNEIEEYIEEHYYYITENNSKIFGALDYSVNSLQRRTSYLYDESNGRLLLVGYPDQSATVYTYDEAGRLKKVSPGLYTVSTNTHSVHQYSDVDYVYNESNLLEKIITDSTEYTISYNIYSEKSQISIEDRNLATYEYYENNGKLKKIIYGNGFAEEYIYNVLESLSEVWYTYNDETRILAYEYEYTSYGQLSKIIDNLSGKTTVYRYDINGRVITSGQYDGAEYKLYSDYSYDECSRTSTVLTKLSYLLGEEKLYTTVAYNYTYNHDGSLSVLRTGGADLSYTYDHFGRVTSKSLEYTASGNTPTYTNEISYGYKSVVNNSSYYVNDYVSKVNGATTASYHYEYDSVGNITKITNIDGKETRYYYDALKQLSVVEDEITNKKYTYIYDRAGNITEIRTDRLTTSSGGGDDDDLGTLRIILPPFNPPSTTTTVNLTYTDSEWGDLLTSYDGTAITYDEIGNPLSYYNGTAYTFTWEGRRLVGAVKGTDILTFVYNSDGLRTSKTVNGATTEYVYNGDMLVAEYAPTYICVYIYDETGVAIGAKYIATTEGSTWQKYFFEKNLQGDVVAVYSDTGTKLISYRYDAWGNTTTTYYNGGASTLASNNHITYRSYYYDTDLGMYYLQSRYYDAKICRFINADAYVSTGQGFFGNNMFAYCGNNPVIFLDTEGNKPMPFWELHWPGAIHREIQEYLRDCHDYVLEVIVCRKRIDLVKGNQAYELKPFTTPKSLAVSQLKTYVALSDGKYVIGQNRPELTGEIPSKHGYTIKFYYMGDGIIQYSFYKKLSVKKAVPIITQQSNENRMNAGNVAIISGAAIGAYFAFGYGGGGNIVSPFKEMELFSLSIY